MKKIITLFICWKLITEKSLKGKMLYLLPLLAIAMIISTIIGDFIYLSVRLMHLRASFVRMNILPVALLLTYAIPAFLIYRYAKNNDIEKLRLQVNRLNIGVKRRIKKRAIIAIIIVASFPSFSLSIISLLIKLNVI